MYDPDTGLEYEELTCDACRGCGEDWYGGNCLVCGGDGTLLEPIKVADK